MTRQRHDSVEKSAQKIVGNVIAAVTEVSLLLRHELGCPYDCQLKFEVAISKIIGKGLNALATIRSVSKFFSAKEIELQKGIKKLFDPNGILNPGKIFV